MYAQRAQAPQQVGPGGSRSRAAQPAMKPPHHLYATYTPGSEPAAVGAGARVNTAAVAATLPAFQDRSASTLHGVRPQAPPEPSPAPSTGRRRPPPPPPPAFTASLTSLRSGGLPTSSATLTGSRATASPLAHTGTTLATARSDAGGGGRRSRALAALRACHRLNNPEDALRLREPARVVQAAKALDASVRQKEGLASPASPSDGRARALCGRPLSARELFQIGRRGAAGPAAAGAVTVGVGDALLPGATEEAAAAAAATVEDSPPRRKRRQDRSFLPEDIQAREEAERRKEEKAERRRARAARREHAEEHRRRSSAPTTHAASEGPGVSSDGEALPSTHAGEDQVDRSRTDRSRSEPSGEVFEDASEDDTEEDVEDEEDDEEEEEEEETVQERKARLEREVVGHYEAMYARRSAAAVVIQSAWRCSRARIELYNRRQLLYRYVYLRQKAAAACIVGSLKAFVLQQRRQRAALAQPSDTTTTTTSSTGAGVGPLALSPAAARAAEERRVVQSVRIIERAVAAWLVRVRARAASKAALSLSSDARLERYAAAAVLVQRWWRVVPAQRAYWLARNAELAEERERQAERDRLHGAAARIQAHVRGMLDRRTVRAMVLQHRADVAERLRRLQDCTDTLTMVLREYALRRARLVREEAAAASHAEAAAAAIQRGWRMTLVRRRIDVAVAEARRMRRAAEVIQRGWRRYHAGRERRYLRQLQHTVEQRRLDGERCRYRAAVCLQRFAREVVLRARFERQARAAHGQRAWAALLLLQSVGRGSTTRRRLAALRELHRRAAEERVRWEKDCHRRSAALAEGILAEVHELYAAYTAAAAHEAEMAELRVCAQVERESAQAAVTVQRAVRRWLARRRTARADAELAEAKAEVLAAVVRVQRGWRAVWGRRQAAQRRQAAVEAERERLMWEEVWRGMEEETERQGSKAVGSDGGLAGDGGDGAGPAVGDREQVWAALYDDDEL